MAEKWGILKMNKELCKKIAEWLELKRVHINEEGYLLYCHGGLGQDRWREVPDFTTSLDACFKYIVPKLWDYILTTNDGVPHADVVSMETNRNGSHRVYVAEAKMPALAFCKAVEKLIAKEPPTLDK